MAIYGTFFADLAEADQRHIRHCIDRLLKVLRASDHRLRSYVDENAKANTDSVTKLIMDLKIVTLYV
jgi:hypothetical protein